MLTSKITVVVCRSALKKESSVAKPKVKESSAKPVDDNSFYEKAVEALYDEIDLHSLLISFTYLPLLSLMTALFQRRISELKRLKNTVIITGYKPVKIKTIIIERLLL